MSAYEVLTTIPGYAPTRLRIVNSSPRIMTGWGEPLCESFNLQPGGEITLSCWLKPDAPSHDREWQVYLEAENHVCFEWPRLGDCEAFDATPGSWFLDSIERARIDRLREVAEWSRDSETNASAPPPEMGIGVNVTNISPRPVMIWGVPADAITELSSRARLALSAVVRASGDNATDASEWTLTVASHDRVVVRWPRDGAQLTSDVMERYWPTDTAPRQ